MQSKCRKSHYVVPIFPVVFTLFDGVCSDLDRKLRQPSKLVAHVAGEKKRCVSLITSHVKQRIHVKSSLVVSSVVNDFVDQVNLKVSTVKRSKDYKSFVKISVRNVLSKEKKSYRCF